jgi:hypothetical protein
MSVGLGIIVFAKSNNNLILSAFVECFAFAVGAVLGLTMLFIVAFIALIVAGFAMFGLRY